VCECHAELKGYLLTYLFTSKAVYAVSANHVTGSATINERVRTSDERPWILTIGQQHSSKLWANINTQVGLLFDSHSNRLNSYAVCRRGGSVVSRCRRIVDVVRRWWCLQSSLIVVSFRRRVIVPGRTCSQLPVDVGRRSGASRSYRPVHPPSWSSWHELVTSLYVLSGHSFPVVVIVVCWTTVHQSRLHSGTQLSTYRL